MSKILIAVLLLATVATASAGVLYTRQSAPMDWTQGARANPEAAIEFTIALKQRNLDILDKWFWEASTPTHPNYQNFKSIEEITELVRPDAADSARVHAWLSAAGVHKSSVTDLGDAMDIKTKVKHAEQLFNTQVYVFTHMTSGVKIARSMGAYSVPREVEDMVEMVTGISTFPVPHLNVRHHGAANDYGVVPQTVDNLYKVHQEARELLKGTAATTSQSVIEFQGQSYDPQDLSAFGTGCNVNVAAVPANQIIGPNDPTNPQVEAELDIEMVASVNLGASNWFWLEAGNGWLYTFAVHFFSTGTVPQVASISYGWWEGDQCTIAGDECTQLGVDSTGYVLRVNTEFQKIGTRGVSLISASGDSGANGRTDPDCTTPHLRPSFPASSPYITAVGATELVQTTTLANPPPICASSGYPCVAAGTEQAVSYAISGFASGGGFSDIAPLQTYQADAVKTYLTSGVVLPGKGYFNQSGRAFPDIAAVGHNVLIVSAGAAEPVGGTSASSPIVASIMALLNVAQIEKTGKPLGFLNPFLYQMYATSPSAFNDITVGDNKCTENGCAASCEGYLAHKGWDPVTGLGTPNFANMLAYVQAQEFSAKKTE